MDGRIDERTARVIPLLFGSEPPPPAPLPPPASASLILRAAFSAALLPMPIFKTTTRQSKLSHEIQMEESGTDEQSSSGGRVGRPRVE